MSSGSRSRRTRCFVAGRRALLPPLPRRPVTPLRHSRGDPARRIIVVEEACRAASPGRRGRGRLQGDEDDGSKFSIEIAKKVEFPMSRLPGNNYSSYLKQIQIRKENACRTGVRCFFPPPLANHGLSVQGCTDVASMNA